MMEKLLQRHFRKKLFRYLKSTRLCAASTTHSTSVHEENIALESSRPFEEIPGFRSIPFLGTSWVYLPFVGKYQAQNLTLADREKYELFGKIHRERFGNFDYVNCYDPQDTEAIFRSEGKYPDRGFLSSMKTYRESRKQWYSNLGVVIMQGKEWYDLRFKLQKSMLKPKAIERYVGPMDQVALDLVNRLTVLRDSNNEVPNTLEELYKWALESVAYIGLDTRLGCLEQNLKDDSEAMRMIRAIQTTFDCMNKLEASNGNMQVWKRFPTPTWRKFVKTMDFFSEKAFEYVSRAMDALKDSKDKELTILQSMLQTEDLDVSGAVTMVMDMMMAGVDTTSHTVGFLLYRLAKNPEKQEKLYKEIVKFLPTLSDRVTPEILKQMTYIKYCIKESTRLDPIVRGFARRIARDTVLSGYRIPAGTICFAITQVTCRQEEHFPAADQFVPERWLDEQNKPNPFLFLPFGFGIRGCIGRRVAELEMLCVVIEIIRRFKLEYHYENVQMLTRLVNYPDRPLRFTFIERKR